MLPQAEYLSADTKYCAGTLLVPKGCQNPAMRRIFEQQPTSLQYVQTHRSVLRRNSVRILPLSLLLVLLLSIIQCTAAMPAVVSLCRQVKDHAHALGNTTLAVLPLRNGLRKLAPTPEYLTPIHAEFLLRYK